MHLELAFILAQLLLGLLQLQRKLGRVLAVAGLQVAFDLRFEHRHVLLVAGHLPAHALDQRPILLQALAARLELFDRRVVLVLHLGNRIGRPKEVGDLIDLRPKCRPKFSNDHRITPCLGRETPASPIRADTATLMPPLAILYTLPCRGLSIHSRRTNASSLRPQTAFWRLVPPATILCAFSLTRERQFRSICGHDRSRSAETRSKNATAILARNTCTSMTLEPEDQMAPHGRRKHARKSGASDSNHRHPRRADRIWSRQVTCGCFSTD